MSTPLMFRSNRQDEYTWMLQSAYRAGFRVYDPEFATAQDADIYEKILRDPDVAAAINTRLHGVACRHWTMELPRKPLEEERRLALTIEDALREIEMFTSARLNLAHAVIRGTSWGYITWAKRFMRLGPQEQPRGPWIVPIFVKDVDRRRFRYGIRRLYDPETKSEVIQTPLEFNSIAREKWERVEEGTPLIRLEYQQEEGRLGYGRGLLEGLYFGHFLKGKLWEEGMAAVERWSGGMVVLGIDGLRDAEYNRSNDVVQQAVISALRKFKSRHVLVKDKMDDLDIKESNGTGPNMALEFIREISRAQRVLILGADLPFGGDRTTGSTELADAQMGVAEALVQYDREILDESITKYIVKQFVWRNRAQLKRLGLLGLRLPRFASIQESKEDPEKAAGVFATLKQAGLKLRADEVYKNVGYTQPLDDDEVIEGDEPPDINDLFGPGGVPGGDDDGDGFPPKGGGAKPDPEKDAGDEGEGKPAPFVKKQSVRSGRFRRAIIY